MLKAPIPDNEAARLEALRGVHLLDTAREERFDRITRLACRLLDAPVSTISLVDSKRLFFKSAQGMSLREAPRDTSFCGHAIVGEGTFVVTDARQDDRFADNPVVAAEPHLRFYAGHPLLSADRQKIGTLCVVDYRPRMLSSTDLQVLQDLAAWAESEIRSLRGRPSDFETVLKRERGVEHPRVDRVTRSWNRSGIVERWNSEWASARAERSPVAAVFIQIDGLGDLDAKQGRERNDVLIAEVAQSIRFSIRPYDTVGRYSENRFLVILPGVDLPRGAVAAERIRQRIGFPKSYNGSISISATAAVVSTSESPESVPSTFLDFGERALELAIKSGGNRTRLGSMK